MPMASVDTNTGRCPLMNAEYWSLRTSGGRSP